MQLFESWASVPKNLTNSVVTIGNFDGVHIGHRALISQVVNRAREMDCPSVLITFEPHPLTVIHPDTIIPAIDCRESIIEKVNQLGIDILVIIPFTADFARVNASDFVCNMIQSAFHPSVLVVGRDHRFGSGRSGDIETLKALAEYCNFQVIIVEPVALDHEIVSSTLIRKYLKAGNVQKSNRMLGAPFIISGFVTKGSGRGKSLGFPTANLNAEKRVLPPAGVYATVTEIRKCIKPSVTYIGRSPTFGKDQLKIETHIFDFSQMIYDSFIRVLFLDMIRFDKRFDDPVDLIGQIRQDVSKAKGIGKIFILST